MAAVIFWLCGLFILYVYALYPVLLWTITRFYSKPLHSRPSGDTALPSVTLLISAYREEAVIAQKIENSLSLDYPESKIQILIAVDGHEDKTREIILSYADRGVEISYSPQRLGKINAITRAIQAARGDIIVFTDANTYFAQDALLNLTAPFGDPTVGAVSGAKRILREDDSLADSEGLYWKYESFIKNQETRLGSCTGASGEMFAIRRDLFQTPPPGVINDDFFLVMHILRKGYRVVYAPSAMTYERISASAKDEMNRRARIVSGRYQALWMGARYLPYRKPVLVWQVFSHKFSRPLVPFAMIGALLANLAAVIWPVKTVFLPFIRLAAPYQWIFLGAQVAFYSLAFLGNLSEKSGTKSRFGKILYLPTFLVNSNFAALVGLVQYFSKRQTNLWQRVARRSD